MIALVRHDAQADVSKARGATPVVIDLNDWPAVTSLLADVDAAIHTAITEDSPFHAPYRVLSTAAAR